MSNKKLHIIQQLYVYTSQQFNQQQYLIQHISEISAIMAQKFSYQAWKRASLDLQKTKQNVQQMSKLYIIAHEKVKNIIRQCQTNLNYNPLDDCERQLQFIKTILQKLADRQNDQYLSNLDPHVLDKYQRNFLDLMQMIKIALSTYDNKVKIDFQGLKRVSENKNIKNTEFSLRNQLTKSQNRMVRTKSGHRLPSSSKKVNNSNPNTQNIDNQYQQLFKQNNKIEFVQPEKFEQQFHERKRKLQQTINNQIKKQGFSLNFKKKYDKFQEYFQERKQFQDLMFSQKYYDQMIEQSKTRKNQPKIYQKKDPDLNKLFPQFNIKTKYMKQQVKQNIMKVIFDVKKQLLMQYHQANVAKMKQANQNGKVNLSTATKFRAKRMSQSSEPSTSQKVQNRFRSTNRPITIQNRRHSLTNFRNNIKSGKLPKEFWQKGEQYKKIQGKTQQMFRSSRMPFYKK